MGRAQIIYLIPYLISFAISSSVGIYGWKRRGVRGAREFAFISFGQAWWTFGYIFELLETQIESKIFWENIKIIGAIIWALSFLVFASKFGEGAPKRRRLFWGMNIFVSVVYIICLFFDNYLKVIRPSAWLEPGYPFSETMYNFTPFSLLVFCYYSLTLLWSLYVLGRAFIRPHRLYNTQVGIVIIGVLIPLAGAVLTIFGIGFTFHRDATPFTFALSALIMGYGLFRYRLLDVIPIGRDTVIENMDYAVVALDVNNRVVDANPAALKLFGQSAESLLGNPVGEIGGKWGETFKSYAEVDGIRAEVSLGEEDDSTHFELKLIPLRDKKNRFVGKLAIIRDITERKRDEDINRKSRDEMERSVAKRTSELAELNETLLREIKERNKIEDELKESEERFRLLANASMEGVAIVDEGKIINANKALQKMLRVELSGLLGKSPLEFLRRESGRFADKRVLDGYEEPSEQSASRKDGSSFFVETQSRPLPYKGRVLRVIAVRDITERKLAQQALEEKEEQYRRIINNVSDVISTYLPNGVITFISETVGRLGYQPDDLVGKYLFEFLHPDDLAGAVEVFNRAIKNPAPETLECRLRRKDGSYEWVEIKGAPILSRGQLSAFNGVIRDITDRKKAEMEKAALEKQMSQAQKMEAIGTLAGGIAHDFNNILGVIVGNAELLLHENHFSCKESRKDLELILTSGLKAKELVKQILIFSRKEESKKRIIDINALLKDSVNILRSMTPKTIKLSWWLPKEPTVILADPTQIQRVLINLCSNSAQAIGNAIGDISIEIERVVCAPDLTGYGAKKQTALFCRISVTDNGVGIPPEIMDKIFDPFFTTKRPGEGTGLGLALAHGIVSDHDGFIRVSSDKGKGTAFEIYLPIVEVALDGDEAGGSLDLPKGAERILLVDDDENMLRTIGRILKRLGYIVVGKASGKDAIEIFRSQPDEFDLLIADRIMPEMTGDMLAKEILSMKPDLPVIFISGSGDAETGGYARDIERKIIVQKPVSIMELANSIRALLDGHKGGKTT